MVRVSKPYDERCTEILNISERLFTSKGYEKTTVNDILEGVGIGKGTFYHYFKSKEEVMDAVIMRMANDAKVMCQEIADMPGLTANEKILKVLTEQPGKNDEIVEQLHHDDNSAMHLKSLIETIHAISPAMTQIIEQGVNDGAYKTPYPQESFEFLFTAAQFLLDPGLFKWSVAELLQKVKAFICILETVLGTEKGGFDFLYELYESVIKAEGTAPAREYEQVTSPQASSQKIFIPHKVWKADMTGSMASLCLIPAIKSRNKTSREVFLLYKVQGTDVEAVISDASNLADGKKAGTKAVTDINEGNVEVKCKKERFGHTLLVHAAIVYRQGVVCKLS